MKTYKNQTESNAKALGFHANFAFASDYLMSPGYKDVTRVISGASISYEVTTYNKETNTCDIQVFTQKEYCS